MNKKLKLIEFLLIFLVIILSSYIIFLLFSKSGEERILVKDLFNKTIIKEENISCEKNYSVAEQIKCFTENAIKNKDINFCNTNISSNETVAVGEWQISCYFAVINETGNYSLCEHIEKTGTISTDTCYLNVVIYTKEKNLCRKIKNESLREYCYKFKMLS
ncbi:MAG: hypothetical protein QXG86_00155 [Candidatus Woesearchaeota archaeon]